MTKTKVLKESVSGAAVTSVTTQTAGNCYQLPLLPQARSPHLNQDEIKEAFQELKAEGKVPTVRLLHAKLGRGSFRTINQCYQSLVKEELNSRLNDIDRQKIPEGRLKLLIDDLAECALKYTIEEDERKLEHLRRLLLSTEERTQANVDELSARIDELSTENIQLKSNIDELAKEKDAAISENNILTDQVNLLSSELNQAKKENELLSKVKELLDKPKLIETVRMNQTAKRRSKKD